MSKISRSDHKFPSVFKRIDTYRTKVENLISSDILNQCPNNSSNRWPEILRSNIHLNESKEIGRTFHDKG